MQTDHLTPAQQDALAALIAASEEYKTDEYLHRVRGTEQTKRVLRERTLELAKAETAFYRAMAVQ